MLSGSLHRAAPHHQLLPRCNCDTTRPTLQTSCSATYFVKQKKKNKKSKKKKANWQNDKRKGKSAQTADGWHRLNGCAFAASIVDNPPQRYACCHQRLQLEAIVRLNCECLAALGTVLGHTWSFVVGVVFVAAIVGSRFQLESCN